MSEWGPYVPWEQVECWPLHCSYGLQLVVPKVSTVSRNLLKCGHYAAAVRYFSIFILHETSWGPVRVYEVAGLSLGAVGWPKCHPSLLLGWNWLFINSWPVQSVFPFFPQIHYYWAYGSLIVALCDSYISRRFGGTCLFLLPNCKISQARHNLSCSSYYSTLKMDFPLRTSSCLQTSRHCKPERCTLVTAQRTLCHDILVLYQKWRNSTNSILVMNESGSTGILKILNFHTILVSRVFRKVMVCKEQKVYVININIWC